MEALQLLQIEVLVLLQTSILAARKREAREGARYVLVFAHLKTLVVSCTTATWGGP